MAYNRQVSADMHRIIVENSYEVTYIFQGSFAIKWLAGRGLPSLSDLSSFEIYLMDLNQI